MNGSPTATIRGLRGDALKGDHDEPLLAKWDECKPVMARMLEHLGYATSGKNSGVVWKAIQRAAERKGITVESPQGRSDPVDAMPSPPPKPPKAAKGLPEDLARALVGIDQDERINLLLKELADTRVDLRKEKARTELIERVIWSSAQVFKPVKPSYPKRKSLTTDPELMVMPISDVQFGEKVLAEQTGGLSEYDYDTFLERLARYKERLSHWLEILRKAYPIDRCIIPFLGDIAQGETKYPKQLAELDKYAMDQVIEGSYHMAELVQYASGLFEQVLVLCLQGNHGEMRESTLNLDGLLYHFMEAALRDQPNVECRTTYCPYFTFWLSRRAPISDNLNWTKFEEQHGEDAYRVFHLIHGQEAKSYVGFPWYGVDRVQKRYQQVTKQIFTAMLLGHHHQEAQAGRWYANGSWVGGSGFSMRKMQGADTPSQRFFLFHPTWGFTVYGRFDLDDEPGLYVDIEGDHVMVPTVQTPPAMA